jgi:predicted transcriptional regulator
MLSLQTKLLSAIRENGTRTLDQLFAVGRLMGHKDSLVERKLRLLVASGLIEVKRDSFGHNKYYEWVDKKEIIKNNKDIKPTQTQLCDTFSRY